MKKIAAIFALILTSGTSLYAHANDMRTCIQKINQSLGINPSKNTLLNFNGVNRAGSCSFGVQYQTDPTLTFSMPSSGINGCSIGESLTTRVSLKSCNVAPKAINVQFSYSSSSGWHRSGNVAISLQLEGTKIKKAFISDSAFQGSSGVCNIP